MFSNLLVLFDRNGTKYIINKLSTKKLSTTAMHANKPKHLHRFTAPPLHPALPSPTHPQSLGGDAEVVSDHAQRQAKQEPETGYLQVVFVLLHANHNLKVTRRSNRALL